MKESKPWYASVGVWGAAVSLVGAALSLLKIQVDPAFLDDLRDWLVSAATLVGAGAALYGRLRASRRIGAGQPGPGPSVLTLALFLFPAMGCSALRPADQTYIAADRATFNAVAPEYLDDLSSHAALTPAQRTRRERTVEAWRLRLEAAEATR